jgi:hypothetical protein
MSETRTADRLDRLEQDVAEIRTTLGRLEPMIIRIDAMLPHLATKAELADLRTDVHTMLARMPTHAYLWGVMAALFTAQTPRLCAMPPSAWSTPRWQCGIPGYGAKARRPAHQTPSTSAPSIKGDRARRC